MIVKKALFPILVLLFFLFAYSVYDYFKNFQINSEPRPAFGTAANVIKNDENDDKKSETKETGKKKDFKNVILIGWDGVQRDHLNELLKNGQLPNYEKYFLTGGSCVNTEITTGRTVTKPGWAEILTGYSHMITGVYSNIDYKPIPQGYTIFERLEEFFGNENIVTLFISGKVNNTGGRGPHKVCVNCITRDTLNRGKLKYWDENSAELITINKDEKPILEEREGEPYFITKDFIDAYNNGLRQSQNVVKKSFEYLNDYGDRRFFMFLHFEEPDEQGHLYGENSSEYSQALINNDKLLADLIVELKRLNIYDNTILYLTSDHGMDENGNEHSNAPATFFCSNEKGLKNNGDRKDATPTILSRYGVDIDKIKPALEGASLYEK